MPTKTQSANLMEVGRKGGGKHYTATEVESRKKAQEMTNRKTRVRLVAPVWLSEEALIVWKKIKKQAMGLELLDNLDAEMLAVYCDAVTQYQAESNKLKRGFVGDKESLFDRNDQIKAVQSWARLIASYAEKLGFTPSGRSRLVKKRADEIAKDEFGDQFD